MDCSECPCLSAWGAQDPIDSQDLVSNTFHPGPRTASQGLCNKDLGSLNSLDKCYFQVGREQFMTSFLIMILKRRQPYKISFTEIVDLINLCPHAFLLTAVRLSMPRFRARLKHRLCALQTRGRAPYCGWPSPPRSPRSPVACSFKVTSTLSP